MTIEKRLQSWFASEHGIAEPRRLARADAESLLVSKFPPGFIARVGQTVERLALVTTPDPLAAACVERARRHPHEPRVECWRAAASDLVRERAAACGLGDDDAELVTAGIESVAAVMRAILWSDPRAGAPRPPVDGERAAWRDALAGMDGTDGRDGEDSRDLFTRHYGAFEGRAVVAYCPGAPYARALLESAWRACTGEPPPA